MSVSRMTRPGAESAARETVLSSSRMLPGPGIRVETRQRLRREHFCVELKAVVCAVPCNEPIREHADVDGPLTQRGQPDRERVHAIVQVLAEAAVANELIERPVRRRDQSEVHLHRALSAQPLESPVFKHSQQLGLGDKRQVADLIEEQRAAVGELDASGLAIVGAGERAFFVAENLGLEEGVRAAPRS